MMLTHDEIHVLLDLIGERAFLDTSGYRWGRYYTGRPWTAYTTDPTEDPKSTEAGWRLLLESASRKLETELNGEPRNYNRKGEIQS